MTTYEKTDVSVRKADVSAKTAGLLLLSLAQFLIALDYSVIYVALPSIGSSLKLGPDTLQWVVSAYAVLFAGFLLVSGRAGDRFGARRILIAALVLFGLAATAGGVADSGALLLAARGAQGLGAALMQPAIIALINRTFEAGPERERALSVWGTIGASGLAAGALLGGVLTTASWRWTMLVNLPVALLCALAAPRLLPADGRRGDRRALSAVGAVLATAASLAVVSALTFAAVHGWGDGRTVGLAVGGVLLAVGFAWHERVSAAPLIDRALRSNAMLRLGAVSTALYMASVGAEFYVVTLILQNRYGYSPLRAGLGFLPLALCIVLGNILAGRFIAKVGSVRLLTVAFVLDAAGLVLLALSASGTGYATHMLPGVIVSGIGHGLTYTSMFVTGTGGLRDEDQGTAGAVLTTSQYMSAAASLAILVLVMGAPTAAGTYRDAFLTTAAFAAAGAVVAGAVTVLRGPRGAR
ncbi:MFS transporter [Catenulispora yoronensis]|uniref:MFS transporter n=1 Tax=Catenulispora yoronensis TaxID=450799 RepID=A0ABP5GMY9_9ACTN